MARFRCCGNSTTSGHAAACPNRPPEYEPPPMRQQTTAEREEQERGCQFDILHFEHIGECRGTCGGERAAQMLDPDGVTIIAVIIDPDDPRAEERLRELEAKGFKRLSEAEVASILAAHERGDFSLEVKTMTFDEIERDAKERERKDDPYMTVTECASVLGFSARWTRALAQRGRFAGALKLLGRWAIPRSAVLIEED